MKKFFELRGKLDTKTRIALQTMGLILLVVIWQIVSMVINSPAILPSPWKVITSFKELHYNDFLLYNAGISIKLNLLGFLEAILIAIPLGFILGLFPIFRELTGKYTDALRYVPLSALTGLFIAWFGIYVNMKVQFLAFGILVYLLPAVIERISKLEDVYPQTAYTLGATKWQTIRTVYFPAVMYRVSDDIRVLTAISWTYIIIPEMINKDGGIGAMIFTAARQSRLDKVFAILLLIITIGFLQDKLFSFIDRKLFKHKYV